MSRTYTSHWIIDVDYAFKGEKQAAVYYWISNFFMLLFFVIRLILHFNTPDTVHVPRITMQSEGHYQFRKDYDS